MNCEYILQIRSKINTNCSCSSHTSVRSTAHNFLGIVLSTYIILTKIVLRDGWAILVFLFFRHLDRNFDFPLQQTDVDNIFYSTTACSIEKNITALVRVSVRQSSRSSSAVIPATLPR